MSLKIDKQIYNNENTKLKLSKSKNKFILKTSKDENLNNKRKK